MPIYEYRCLKCNRKSETITFRVSEEVSANCSHCGSLDVKRVPSRVRVRMSEETRMDRMADPSRFSGLDENDPKSMAKWMKSVTREMGDDLSEDFDVDAVMDEAMAEKDDAEGGASGIGALGPGGDDD